MSLIENIQNLTVGQINVDQIQIQKASDVGLTNTFSNNITSRSINDILPASTNKCTVM